MKTELTHTLSANDDDVYHPNYHSYTMKVLGIPSSGGKSRVETQTNLCLQLTKTKDTGTFPLTPTQPQHMVKTEIGTCDIGFNFPNEFGIPYTHLAIDKINTIKRNKTSIKHVDFKKILSLQCLVYCKSEPRKPVKVCDGCARRERKRIQRAKSKKHIHTSIKITEREQSQILLFNAKLLTEFSNGSVILPTRITCYCRHHNENGGFIISFVLRDNLERIVAKAESPPIMITDDHKTPPNNLASAPTQQKRRSSPVSNKTSTELNKIRDNRNENMSIPSASSPVLITRPQPQPQLQDFDQLPVLNEEMFERLCGNMDGVMPIFDIEAPSQTNTPISEPNFTSTLSAVNDSIIDYALDLTTLDGQSTLNFSSPDMSNLSPVISEQIYPGDEAAIVTRPLFTDKTVDNILLNENALPYLDDCIPTNTYINGNFHINAPISNCDDAFSSNEIVNIDSLKHKDYASLISSTTLLSEGNCDHSESCIFHSATPFPPTTVQEMYSPSSANQSIIDYALNLNSLDGKILLDFSSNRAVLSPSTSANPGHKDPMFEHLQSYSNLVFIDKIIPQTASNKDYVICALIGDNFSDQIKYCKFGGTRVKIRYADDNLLVCILPPTNSIGLVSVSFLLTDMKQGGLLEKQVYCRNTTSLPHGVHPLSFRYLDSLGDGDGYVQSYC